MTPHSAALPRTAHPLWLLVLLSLLTWLAACSDSPPPEPVISVQPSDASAVAGTAATLSVTASGPDVAYQWQLSSDGGTTWANVAGATQASYATPPTSLADSGKRYRVVVSAAGISVNSSAVQLTVTAAVVVPTLTVQPAAQSATAPDPATFSVTAGGTAPSFQWQRSTDSGATFTNITGATAASYSTGATATTMNGERFRVVVTNSAGSVTSSAVVLSVTLAPVATAFTTQPANQSVTAGSAAAFTVVATGTPAPTLQWQRSTDAGSTFNNISGATDPTYNTGLTTLSQTGERYRVLASNSAGSATSNAATLTVNAAPQAPVISTQPTAQSVTAPGTATFTAAASGVPTPTWQWQLSTDNAASFANITGATNPSYTTPATVVGDNGKRFRVVASNSAGTVNGNIAVLTVTASLSVNQDTGVNASQCYQLGSNILVSCSSAGALALNDLQDGMVGRDVTTPDPTDGKLGFAFEAVAGGCAKDKLTGLTWEVKTADGGLRDKDKTYTNYDDVNNQSLPAGGRPTASDINSATNTVGFIAAVNATSLCGLTSWRLPTADELQGLVDYGVFYDYGVPIAARVSAIDAIWFPNTQPSGFWSSTRFVGTPNYALSVSFDKGSVGGSVRYQPLYVRLVRGETVIPTPRYSYSTDGDEVLDSTTGLIWQRCALGAAWTGSSCTFTNSTFTHEQVLSLAKSQANSSGKAWRVPNVKELNSITDKSRGPAAIDGTAFPSTSANLFWSSTPYLDNLQNAWAINFAYGNADADLRSSALSARLVRTGP